MQENPETATGTATATATGPATDSTATATGLATAAGNATASGNGTASANGTASGNGTAAAPRTASLELVKELPRGSVGVVHQARSPQQNRSVALRKFDVPEWLDDVNELLKKILAEAKAASALDHPNIAKLYTCGYKDFTVFMTVEFVEGPTLREFMAKRQPEMAEVLQMSKQLLTALDYAHSKGVYHNFLNPNNIKVLPDGTLKLLDFGLLRDKNLLTHTPTKKLENAPYLSPEQVKHKPSDRASNIFNAATIIYQLYTARSPFHGPHLGEIDRSITDVDPHPMQMAHARVPEQISKVVLKALSKNPANRYASGQQFFSELEEAAKNEPVSRANSTGSFPAYQGSPGPNASQSIRVQPSPNASQSFRAVPGPNASQSFKAIPSGSASQVIKAPTPGTTGTTYNGPVKTGSRGPVSTANHWKLVGGVVAGLVVVVVAAMLFQHRTPELPDDPATQSSKPASSAAAPFSRKTANAQSAQDAQGQAPAEGRQHTSSRASKAARNATAAPVAPPAPAEGQLIVSSMPMGATVEIEGRAGQQWKAPQTIPGLAAGTYKISFGMPGYATETRSVQVTGGARTPVDIRLNAVKGFITVTGTPSGAHVLINGKDTGKVTPIEFLVEPGTQNIVVRKQGFLDATTDLKVAVGQSVNYAPKLMAAGRTDNIQLVGSGGVGKLFGGNGGSSQGMARIEIKSEPKGAVVTINGTPLQKPTPLEIQVEPGNYDIVIQKDGYKPIHESAIVGIDDRIKINRPLSH
ncbi:MAG TPA: serine/threonine-protein kinase [Candidatus Angelobacter sp.]|jgi:serine/threonine-protein kinase|nr:serine/threonine-protein kinase [Candidatus Angelobacter sp.]